MAEVQQFFDIPLTVRPRDFPTRAEFLSFLELVKPRRAPVPMLRLGGAGDGAYLVPDDLEGVTDCLSPGVDNRKAFEDDLARRFGIRSHMVDASSSPERFDTPLIEGLQTFQPKWLEPVSGEKAISLTDWVERLEPLGPGDLMLQMDIEGAEYRNLLQTPRDVLARFRILLIEFHGLQWLGEGAVLREVARPVMQKLAADFVCVHAHPNNWCPSVRLGDTGIDMPSVLELSFLRRDRMRADRWFPVSLPHPLDIHNSPERPPLHLGPAWSNGKNPWRARLQVARDRLAYRWRHREAR